MLFLFGAIIFSLLLTALLFGFINLFGLRIEVDAENCFYAEEEMIIRLEVSENAGRDHFFVSCTGDTAMLLRSGAKRLFKLRLSKLGRGVHTLDNLELFSSYPFGFFNFRKVVQQQTCWVFPRPINSHWRAFYSRLAGSRFDKNDSEGDYWSQAQYQPGEDARRINWILSSKSDREMTTIKTVTTGLPVCVWIDSLPTGDEEIERFLSILCGLFVEANKEGRRLLVWCGDITGELHWKSVGSRSGLIMILKWLALIQPLTRLDPPDSCCGERNLKGLGLDDFT